MASIGDFRFEVRSTGYWIVLTIPLGPDGTEPYLIDLAVTSDEFPNTWRDQFPDSTWGWNGDFEAPTLSPSIWHNKPNGWHGFLEAGKLRSV